MHVSSVVSALLLVSVQQGANAQSPASVALDNSSSVVTITWSTCYNPAIASVPYTVLANGSSAVTTLFPGSSAVPNSPSTGTTSFTTTLPNGVSEVVYDHIYATTSSNGVVNTVTTPFSTSILGSPNSSTRTTSFTTTLLNGVSEIIYEYIYGSTSSGGAGATITAPYSTSVLGSPFPSTRTTSITTTLSNSVSEIVFDYVYTITGSDGTVSTITQPFSTSVLDGPGSPKTAITSYTTSLSNGVSEIVYDYIYTITGSDGAAEITTQPFSTSIFVSPSSPITETTSFITTLSNGVSEVVYDYIYTTAGSDGGAETTTQPFSTSILGGPTTRTTSVTTTLPNSVSEIIYDIVYETISGGSVSTITEALSTSILGSPTPTSLSGNTSSLASSTALTASSSTDSMSSSASEAFTTLTVFSNIPTTTTDVSTTTQTFSTTISGTPTTITSVSTYATTFTTTQTTTTTSLAPYFTISGYSCAVDQCLAAVQDLAGISTVAYDCSSFMTRTSTPPTSTISATATTTTTATSTSSEPSTVLTYTETTSYYTDTSYVDEYIVTYSTTTTTASGSLVFYGGSAPATATPVKRGLDPEHTVPAYAVGYCTTSAMYASACSCLGVTASTSTVAAPSTTTTVSTSTTADTVITTTTFLTTDYTSTQTTQDYFETSSTLSYLAECTVSPQLYILQVDYDETMYLAVDADGAAYLSNSADAEPFYIDQDTQTLVDWKDPTKSWVDQHTTGSGPTEDRVLVQVPGTSNLPIVCSTRSTSVYGDCQANDPQSTNSDGGLIYGFLTCPDYGTYLYMYSSMGTGIACPSGYIAITDFNLIEFTPPPRPTSFAITATSSNTAYNGLGLSLNSTSGNTLLLSSNESQWLSFQFPADNCGLVELKSNHWSVLTNQEDLSAWYVYDDNGDPLTFGYTEGWMDHVLCSMAADLTLSCATYGNTPLRILYLERQNAGCYESYVQSSNRTLPLEDVHGNLYYDGALKAVPDKGRLMGTYVYDEGPPFTVQCAPHTATTTSEVTPAPKENRH